MSQKTKSSQSVYGFFELQPGFVDKFRAYVVEKHRYWNIRDEVAKRHGYDLSMPFEPQDSTARFNAEMKTHTLPLPPHFKCLCDPGWHGSDCTDNDVLSLWWLEDTLEVELGYMTEAVFKIRNNIK